MNLFGGAQGGSAFSVSTTLLHYSELTIKGVFHHTPRYVETAPRFWPAAWCRRMRLSPVNAHWWM